MKHPVYSKVPLNPMVNFQYIEIFSGIVSAMENLIIPLDTTYRVVPGIKIASSKQVSRRIPHDYTERYC